MLKIDDQQLSALEQFGVHVGKQSNSFLSVGSALTELGSEVLFEKIHNVLGAPTNTVAASVYLRRHGFFIAAQLHILSEFNTIWTGNLQDISLLDQHETITFSIPATNFNNVKNREEAIRFILESYGHPVVEYFSKHATISKLILWENIWGYVLWMYSMLLQQNSTNAQRDLDILLEDDTWRPAMRRSPFKQYLKNKQALEAMAKYERTTCCLYKELPNSEKCPYCPLAK